MKNRNGKWWLALITACFLAPAVLAYGGEVRGGGRYGGGGGGGKGGGGGGKGGGGGRQQMPEGGSAAIYLAGAGLTCLGGMFFRSKLAKPVQS